MLDRLSDRLTDTRWCRCDPYVSACLFTEHKEYDIRFMFERPKSQLTNDFYQVYHTNIATCNHGCVYILMSHVLKERKTSCWGILKKTEKSIYMSCKALGKEIWKKAFSCADNHNQQGQTSQNNSTHHHCTGVLLPWRYDTVVQDTASSL